MQLKNFDFKQKLYHHPDQLIAIRNEKRPFPVTLEIDLTNLCNHDCYFCVVKSLREQYQVSLETDTVLRAIREAKNMGLKGISFTGGGEPLIHKNIYEILKETHDMGIDTGLMTNGALLKEERVEELLDSLTWIRISVGGGNREQYKKIQGRDDYNTVIKYVFLLGKCRKEKQKNVNIGVRMLLDKENYHSLLELCENLRGSGIDYVQIAPDCRDETYSVFGTEEFKRVAESAEKILKESSISLLLAGFTQDQEERSFPKKCYAHYFQMALTATGDLVFCKNVRGQEAMTIGNIYQNSIAEIWDSPRNKELEKKLCPKECNEICKNMQINVAVEQFLNPTYDMSVNFIG